MSSPSNTALSLRALSLGPPGSNRRGGGDKRGGGGGGGKKPGGSGRTDAPLASPTKTRAPTAVVMDIRKAT